MGMPCDPPRSRHEAARTVLTEQDRRPNDVWCQGAAFCGTVVGGHLPFRMQCILQVALFFIVVAAVLCKW